MFLQNLDHRCQLAFDSQVLSDCLLLFNAFPNDPLLQSLWSKEIDQCQREISVSNPFLEVIQVACLIDGLQVESALQSFINCLCPHAHRCSGTILAAETVWRLCCDILIQVCRAREGKNSFALSKPATSLNASILQQGLHLNLLTLDPEVIPWFEKEARDALGKDIMDFDIFGILQTPCTVRLACRSNTWCETQASCVLPHPLPQQCTHPQHRGH